MTTDNWPPLPDITSNDPLAEAKLELYKAKLEEIKTNRLAELEKQKGIDAADLARETAAYANEYATLQESFKGTLKLQREKLIDLSKELILYKKLLPLLVQHMQLF